MTTDSEPLHPGDRLLTLHEAAAVIGMGVRALEREIKAGKGPAATRVSTKAGWLIRDADARAWLVRLRGG